MAYTGSKAQAGRGTTIGIGGTPTLIGEVTDIPMALPKWETAEVTNLDSGSDAEYITTIRKSSNFSVKGNRVASDAGQVAVQAAYATGTVSSFTVQLLKTGSQTTTGDKYVFNALVLSQSFDITPAKQIEYALDLQITGAVTYTAGT
jgi:hypothetical protein